MLGESQEVEKKKTAIKLTLRKAVFFFFPPPEKTDDSPGLAIAADEISWTLERP